MMLYSPHLLYVRVTTELQKDEYGRTKRPAEDAEWKCVGACRCDDSNIAEVTSANGEVFRPSFHIVCDGGVEVKMGDNVRIRQQSNMELRGEGVVRNITTCNYLDYKSIYI